MPKRGRKRKKSRTHVVEQQQQQETKSAAMALTTSVEDKIPKTLVARRGRCEPEVGELVRNLRQMMLPYTALHFQDDNNNQQQHKGATISQYVKHLALPMGITHMLLFSQSKYKQQQQQPQDQEQQQQIHHQFQNYLNLRLIKTPQGPTLWFRVHQFSLNRHVQSIQKRPFHFANQAAASATALQHPPIVVTNNFGSSSNNNNNNEGGAGEDRATTATPPHVKLMRITFQNMFPAINVATVSLSACRRVVLFHLEDEEEEEDDDEVVTDTTNAQAATNLDQQRPKRRQQLVQVRHFAIKTSTPSHIQNRRVQRLLHPTQSKSKAKNKKFPNLHHVQDIADYILGQSSSRSGGSSTGSLAASDSEVSDDEDQVEVVLPATNASSKVPGKVARKKSKTNTDAADLTASSDAASTTSSAESSSNTGRSSSASSTTSNNSAVLKLVELGPRLTLELIKVEKGLEGGGGTNNPVLYHAHIHKSPKEVQALQQRHEQKMQLKRQRQAIQQANVERKQQEKEQQLLRKKQKQDERENNKNMPRMQPSGDDDDELIEAEDDGDSDSYDDQEDAEEEK